MSNNPYELWKMFQDVRGNEFFFNVFLNQKYETGINYKEINSFLTNRKIYENDFDQYKYTVQLA